MTFPMQKAVNAQMLRASTRKFFGLHWSKESPAVVPKWVRLDQANVLDSIREGGCYAILDGSGNVCYVGLGIAKAAKEGGAGGVLGRLYRHVLVRGALGQGDLEPKRKIWSGMSGILYIPFGDQEYLAAALESYLIRTFGEALPHNKSRVRRSS